MTVGMAQVLFELFGCISLTSSCLRLDIRWNIFVVEMSIIVTFLSHCSTSSTTTLQPSRHFSRHSVPATTWNESSRHSHGVRYIQQASSEAHPCIRHELGANFQCMSCTQSLKWLCAEFVVKTCNHSTFKHSLRPL